MQNETYVKQLRIENSARLEKLIEKGNQLHDQAIFDFFAGLVTILMGKKAINLCRVEKRNTVLGGLSG